LLPPYLRIILDAVVVVWQDKEMPDAQSYGAPKILSYESWVRESYIAPDELEFQRLISSYPRVNWTEVIAAERSFTDYSFLGGSAGDRAENVQYVTQLLHRIVSFFEYFFASRN